jgi:osmotically-inducible protein OsmY
MKWMLTLLVLLLAVTLVAHPQNNQQSPPPNTGSSKEQSQPLTNEEVRDKIQDIYDTRGDFNNARLSTSVTDTTVTVSGQCQSAQQREAAYEVARKYAGNRKVEAQWVPTR